VSNHLTSLAYKADAKSLLRKSVLVMLADKASDDGSGIWASKQTMADELCCSKQAILNTLQAFISEGLLTETGRRKNRNGFTITYALNIEALEALPRVKRWSNNQSTGLTSQPGGPVNEVDETSQPGGPEPSLTIRGSEAKASSPPRAWALPAGVSLQVWTDFLSNRTRKRAGNTPTTWKRFQDDLARISAQTGIPPPQLIEHAAGAGWAGIYDPNERNQRNERPSNPLAIAVQRIAAHH
jgi:hypothetical protein